MLKYSSTIHNFHTVHAAVTRSWCYTGVLRAIFFLDVFLEVGTWMKKVS